MLWSIISLVLLLLYVGLILFYSWQWKNPGAERDLDDAPLKTRASIIIVGRNEGQRLLDCVNSILENDYPSSLYEIIYIDDHSEDDSIRDLRNIGSDQLRVFKLEDYQGQVYKSAYKKTAIDFALQVSNGKIIIHTDADTLVGKHWIREHVASYEMNGANFTAAPVLTIQGKGFLSAFQQLDLLITMGITGAGIQASLHFLANGANMSYSKNVRDELNLSRTRKYASGDDVFLIQEMAKSNSEKISFLVDYDSLVYTHPEGNWKAFFRQRFRWAGKSAAYNDRKLQSVVIMVFLMNLSLLFNFMFLFWNTGIVWLFLIQLIIKLIVDLYFINLMAKSFNQKVAFHYVFLSILFYPFYYIITGISVLLPLNVSWKGRKI